MKKQTKKTSKPAAKKPAAKKSTKPAKKVTAKKPAKPSAKKPSAKKPAKKVVAAKPAKPVSKKPFKLDPKVGTIIVLSKPVTAPVSKSKKPHISGFIPTVAVDKKQKFKKPAIVQTEHGLGLVYEHEPKVSVKQGPFNSIEKTIVHLVKDNMEPRTMNGQPKKILTNNFSVIKPAEEIKVERTKRVKGEPSNKDFSKYKFQGKLLSKGRLILAVIAKFAEDNNPSMIELNTAFPHELIRPYGKGLFVSLEEAERINTESKRTRFFTNKEDVVKIKGAKVAVSNQIDGELVKRFLPIAEKHGCKITMENSTEVKPVVIGGPKVTNNMEIGSEAYMSN